MATYKVIQDIESEDKLLGPLSMRQFIYAIITIAFGAAGFMLASRTNLLLMIPFLPPMGLFGLLAAPFGRDQSSEVWLLAKIRFAFKPRRRIWDQSGLSDYVQILVPKKVEKHLTDGLDQTQVKSRLHALAETLDSRGWAVKNVTDTSVFTPPAYLGQATDTGSDRLVQATLPAVPVPTVSYDDADMLDEQHNPTAQKLDNLIEQSEQARRQSLMAAMHNPAQAQPIPTVSTQPGPTTQSVATPQPTATPMVSTTPPIPQAAAQPTATDEAALLNTIHQSQAAAQAATSHMGRIPTAEEAAKIAADTAKAAAKDEELKRLATNDDLDIATIARQANKDGTQDLGDNEVVISLH